MKFQYLVNDTTWKIRCGSVLPKLIGAAGVSLGHTTYFKSKICPNAASLAHEWYHVATTNAFRYALSYTIGRVWKSDYWKTHEIGANFYATLHKDDGIFMRASSTIRRNLPAEWPTVTITHSV